MYAPLNMYATLECSNMYLEGLQLLLLLQTCPKLQDLPCLCRMCGAVAMPHPLMFLLDYMLSIPVQHGAVTTYVYVAMPKLSRAHRKAWSFAGQAQADDAQLVFRRS